jgi:hypothetical protein
MSGTLSSKATMELKTVIFLHAYSLLCALVLPFEEELCTMSGTSLSMATMWFKAVIFLNVYSLLYALVLSSE